MPDPLKIDITSTFDPKGTDAAAEGIAKVETAAGAGSTATAKTAKAVEELGKQSEKSENPLRELGHTTHGTAQIFEGLRRASEGGIGSLVGVAQAIRGVFAAASAGPVAAAAAAVVGLVLLFKDRLSPAVEETNDSLEKTGEAVDKTSSAIADLNQQNLDNLLEKISEVTTAIDAQKARLLENAAALHTIELAAIAAERAQLKLAETRGELPHEDAAKRQAELDRRVRAADENDPIERAKIEAQTARAKANTADLDVTSAQRAITDFHAKYGFSDPAEFDDELRRLKDREQTITRTLSDFFNALTKPQEEQLQRELEANRNRQRVIETVSENKQARDEYEALNKREADALKRSADAARDAEEAEARLVRLREQQKQVAGFTTQQASAEDEIKRAAAQRADALEQAQAAQRAAQKAASTLAADPLQVARNAHADPRLSDEQRKLAEQLERAAQAAEKSGTSENLRALDKAVSDFGRSFVGQSDTVVDFLVTIAQRLRAAEAKAAQAEAAVAALQSPQPAASSRGGGSLLIPLTGARAGGGKVIKGGAYLVGEKGKEIFQPMQDGEIIPNDKIADTTINDRPYTPPPDTTAKNPPPPTPIVEPPAPTPIVDRPDETGRGVTDHESATQAAFRDANARHADEARAAALKKTPSAGYIAPQIYAPFTTPQASAPQQAKPPLGALEKSPGAVDADGRDTTADAKAFRDQQQAQRERNQAERDRARGNFDSAAIHEERAGRLDPQAAGNAQERSTSQARRGDSGSPDFTKELVGIMREMKTVLKDTSDALKSFKLLGS